jgi:hypothetical protein
VNYRRSLLSTAIAAAVAMPAATTATPSDPRFDTGGGGEYRAGDFHNHTTCSDGSTSVRTLTRKSLEYHDWFIHVGHSGRGPRDCRVDDFLTMAQGRSGAGEGGSAPINQLRGRGLALQGPYWSNNGVVIKGDDAGGFTDRGKEFKNMWRWQSLQEFNLEGIVDEREYPGNDKKVAFLGLEWVVPGHEHASNSISTGNYDVRTRADAHRAVRVLLRLELR